MSMFIGLIDGDGYIAITKIGLDNIRMELVLSVDIEDLKLLQHIKNVLKIGRINEYPNISGRCKTNYWKSCGYKIEDFIAERRPTTRSAFPTYSSL